MIVTRPLLATDAECCLAGSAVLAPELAPEAVTICPPAAVFDATCRAVFGAVATLVERGITFTPGRLAIHLEAHGITLAADVADAIRQSVPTGANILYFARIVRDAATRRAIDRQLERITRANQAGEPLDAIGAAITALAHDFSERMRAAA